jgi:hypothetical protein
MRYFLGRVATGCVWISWVCLAGERINQEGRILGPQLVVTNSVLFNTPQADAIASAMQIFPVTSAWNEDISHLPVLPNSDAMIAQIMADLSSTRRTLRAFQEMNFVLVPESQQPIPINFVDYPDESDPSPYPIPANMPIETWPTGTGLLTLQQWQQDVNNTGGDRHSIVVQPGKGLIYETWQAQLVGTNWQASNGAKFDLNSNDLRPAGWTSGDAAGLPMFPALPRYDECERGMVEHACRIVVYRTRKEYLYPANHYASSTAAAQTNVPAMGERLRLKSSFVIPSNWATEEKALLLGLKKYGALVADNGNFFSISITPDNRWPANAFGHISSIVITNFEVVQGTGPNAGPRSPGAPIANAGVDQTVPVAVPAQLRGFVSYTNTQPATLWRMYSGPGTARFNDSAQTNATVTFDTPGLYKLMLSADDGVHAVAYAAVTITATQVLRIAVAPLGTGVSLSWSGGSPPYVVERSANISTVSWQPVLTNNTSSGFVPFAGRGMFFRVRSQ